MLPRLGPRVLRRGQRNTRIFLHLLTTNPPLSRPISPSQDPVLDATGVRLRLSPQRSCLGRQGRLLQRLRLVPSVQIMKYHIFLRQRLRLQRLILLTMLTLPSHTSICRRPTKIHRQRNGATNSLITKQPQPRPELRPLSPARRPDLAITIHGTLRQAKTKGILD
jgi:hypothetical protein